MTTTKSKFLREKKLILKKNELSASFKELLSLFSPIYSTYTLLIERSLRFPRISNVKIFCSAFNIEDEETPEKKSNSIRDVCLSLD